MVEYETGMAAISIVLKKLEGVPFRDQNWMMVGRYKLKLPVELKLD
jgi:hypothetical protein